MWKSFLVSTSGGIQDWDPRGTSATSPESIENTGDWNCVIDTPRFVVFVWEKPWAGCNIIWVWTKDDEPSR